MELDTMLNDYLACDPSKMSEIESKILQAVGPIKTVKDFDAELEAEDAILEANQPPREKLVYETFKADIKPGTYEYVFIGNSKYGNTAILENVVLEGSDAEVISASATSSFKLLGIKKSKDLIKHMSLVELKEFLAEQKAKNKLKPIDFVPKKINKCSFDVIVTF